MSRHQPATITNLSRPDQQSRIPVRQARESGQLTTVQGCSSSETTTSVSSSAVPKASLLASPTGSVTIEDGQFNAIGRDHISVTVINGCPYDENMNALGRQRKAKKTISVNNKNVQTVQDTEKEETEHLKDLSEGDINGYKWSPRAPRHCAIYVRNLLLEGYGWPFYVPGPNMSLPEAYRNRMGMQNGDVGIINILGYFEFFFNICHPADHPINYQGVPKNFKQLQIELTDIQKHFDLNGENFISSSSITNSSSLKFESLASEGAILAMPDGAISEDVRNEAMFKKYVSIHVEDWYRFIRNIRGRNVKNGDIRLVIGYHKTSRWCMVTFSNSMALQANRNPFLLELIPVTETNVYDWKQSGTAATVVKTGPGTQELEDLRKTDPVQL